LRVLIVKLSSLGDVVQTLPVVHDLLTHVDPVVIDWVVEEAFAPLLGEVLGIERVVRYAGRRWRHRPFAANTRRERAAFLAELRREPYDAVIDCQGLVKSALVARRARLAAGGHRYTYANASELCGYEWPVRYMVDRPLAMERRVHAVRRARLLAARALGYEIDSGNDAGSGAGYGAAEGAAEGVGDGANGGAGDGASDEARDHAQAPRVDWRFPVPATLSRDVMLAHGTTRSDNEWPELAWADIGQRLVARRLPLLPPRPRNRVGHLPIQL